MVRFNLIANLSFWNKVPRDIQAIVNRNVVKYVARQRCTQNKLNLLMVDRLTKRGMVFNQADTASFRNLLGSFYTHWKQNFGTTAWNFLETEVGKIS